MRQPTGEGYDLALSPWGPNLSFKKFAMCL